MDQRQIKFRAWDKTKNYYLDWLTIRLSAFADYGPDKFILEQYTGLKDNNGKEIYEGDIIQHWKRLYEVSINFNGYYLQRYKLWRGEFVPSFRYSMSLITKPSKDRFGGEVDSAEVIGNIRENSELISSLVDAK